MLLFVLIAFQLWQVNFNDQKAVWYLDALDALHHKFTRVKVAVVWSERWENDDGAESDLRVNSSLEALDAFRYGISSEYFLGKDRLREFKHFITIPAYGCFIGAYVEEGTFEDSVSVEKLKWFGSLTGKDPAFVPISIFWGRKRIPRKSIEAILRFGAIPMIRLMPWGKPYKENFPQTFYSLDKIISGDFDSFLLRIAKYLKSLNTPVFITFGEEMNGDWFPWSGIFNGGGTTNKYGKPDFPDGPERYRDAFRHVVKLFRKAGADNVIWYFQPNAESSPEKPWNFIYKYYPGDKFVDWIGVSVYGAQTPEDSWVSFSEVFGKVYLELISLAPSKPLMVSEWGVTEPEKGHRKK